MAKKIIFPILALFLAYRSWELLRAIWFMEAGTLEGPLLIFIPVLLNLFITGVFAFPGFVFPTHRLLPSGYYKVRNKARVLKFYRVLGIEYFKKALLLAFWGKEKNRKRFFDGTRQGLENLEYQTKQSEFGHLGAFVLLQAAVLLLLMKEAYWMALITMALNVVFNFYPIVLQRHHRIQMERVKNILDKRQASTKTS
jgi:hypothetical protein